MGAAGGVRFSPAITRSIHTGDRLLLLFVAYENIAKSDPGGRAMVDLITSDRRFGPAIGFIWLPAFTI